VLKMTSVSVMLVPRYQPLVIDNAIPNDLAVDGRSEEHLVNVVSLGTHAWALVVGTKRMVPRELFQEARACRATASQDIFPSMSVRPALPN